MGVGRGEGVAGRGVHGQSPFAPVQERAKAQVAASIQVQSPAHFPPPAGAILKKAKCTSDRTPAAASI